MKISIISPVYMAEGSVSFFVDRIIASVSKLTDDFEIILVEDGGSDNSWLIIEKIATTNLKVVGIKLSKNFGQHHAIFAGLENATGDWVVVIDCDMQDSPEEIESLYKKAISGFDIVLAKRNYRKDNLVRKISSALFYKILSYLTGTKQDESIANYGIYSRKVIDSVCSMKESIKYFPTMISWVGFKSTKIDVNHGIRHNGKTSYSYKKLFNLALDIILANSDKPIRLLIKMGLLVSLSSFAIAIFEFIKWIHGDIIVLGYASLIISIWFSTGIIISTLGIIGLYVGKTFEEVKNRPTYIISKKINRD